MATWTQTLMVGPDLEGHGGISRVAQLWRQAGLFSDLDVRYHSSVSEFDRWRLQSFATTLPRFLCRLPRARAVYVHTSSYRSFFRKAPFLLAGQLARKPTILHIHPSHFLDFLDGLTGIVRKEVLALVSRCTALAVLSEGMKEGLTRRFPSSRIEVIPNPVDVGGMASTESVTREDHLFLYLGWYIREKGIFELAEAMGHLAAEYPQVRLNLHGTKDRTEFDRFVAERKLGRHVVAGDWLEEEDKLAALRRATALVLPSYSEGLPNVILEALATRTPVISTSVGGLAELLDDGVNASIVPPANVAGLLAGLRKCLENKSSSATMAEEGYQVVCARHSLEQVRTRLNGFIQSLNI